GWKANGAVLVSGPDTERKAKTIADIFWKKLNHNYEATRTDMLGSGSIWPEALRSGDSNEILLRFAVRDKDLEKVKDFGKALSTLILSGPAGMAVTTGGRPRPSLVVTYWPALMHRSRVKAKVLVIDTGGDEDFHEITFPIRVQSVAEKKDRPQPRRRRMTKLTGKSVTVKLQQICYARSGDKGDTCNIGVLARSPQIYDWLVENLTSARVKTFFKGITLGKVIRYELDNLLGLNFLLEETLGGGGTRSLMIDPQGKTLAQALMQMEVSVPPSLLKSKPVKR
ncbi:MAG: DUF1446 domain-containing protein, partial [Candidatus Zixiibacteriota bacterium]